MSGARFPLKSQQNSYILKLFVNCSLNHTINFIPSDWNWFIHFLCHWSFFIVILKTCPLKKHSNIFWPIKRRFTHLATRTTNYFMWIKGMGDGTSQLKKKNWDGWWVTLGILPSNALFFLASTLWFKIQESRYSQGWAHCEFRRLLHVSYLQKNVNQSK